MADDAHLIIETVSPEGEPTHPRKNASTFVSQCGVLVRDHIPISIREWNKTKNADGVSFVTDVDKEQLWESLISKFSLPKLASAELTEAMRLRVKHWALKKMAVLFNNYKNKLYKDYIKAGKAPEFTGPLEKQRDHWEAFLRYRESDVAKQRSEKNKANAAKKIYHHRMGTGGYKTFVPLWNQKEANMLAQGIVPATRELPDRARNWFFGHGGDCDAQTGDLIAPPAIAKPKENLETTIQEV